MLPIIFLFAGGIALVGAMIPDEPSDSDIDENEEDNQSQRLDLPFETNLFDYLPESPSEVSRTLNSENRLDASAASEPDLIDTTENPHDELSDAASGDFEISIVEILEDNIPTYPPALSDWTQNETVNILELGEDDVLSVYFPAGNIGSLVVLDADYVETASQATSTTYTVHHGTNVYFVPKGEEFPSQYEWSEEGAVLFNTSSYHDDNTDFGGIRFLARIDSGTSINEMDNVGNSIHSINNMLGDSQVVSNLPLVYF